MPQNAAGWRIEPPVSEPMAPRQSRAATADAEPPDEPPGTSSRLSPARRHGFVTGPKWLVSLDEPMANSSMLVLPSITAPARNKFAVTVDSYVGTKPSRMRDPAHVITPLVQNRSLTAIGMPSSALASPARRRASEASASASARSGVSVTKAFRFRAFSTAAMCASVSSRAETSPASSASRASAMPSAVSSSVIR